jgi:TetR/AcrR family transcriptional repressor of mexJK operon
MEERSTKPASPARSKAPSPEKRRGPGRPTLSNEQLLDKALDVFLEHGFEGTRIDEITAVAGVAKRTIYQRYGDKETLFRTALQRAIDEFVIPDNILQAEEREDLSETLLRVGRVLVANLLSPAGLRLLRITNAESSRRPEIGEYSYRYGTERTFAYLADLFRRRLALERPEHAARAFLYLVVWGPATMAAWGVPLDMKAINEHASYCIKLFMEGLQSADGDVIAGKARGKAASSAIQLPSTPALDASRLKELEDLRVENRQLRKLLVESMLKSASRDDQLTSSD